MASPLAPAPAIGPALVAAGPPAAVDLAIEATHGDTGPINRTPVLDDLDDLQSGDSLETELIPWTPSDPSVVPLATTDLLINSTRRKATDSRITISLVTPDRSALQR